MTAVLLIFLSPESSSSSLLLPLGPFSDLCVLISRSSEATWPSTRGLRAWLLPGGFLALAAVVELQTTFGAPTFFVPALFGAFTWLFPPFEDSELSPTASC